MFAFGVFPGLCFITGICVFWCFTQTCLVTEFCQAYPSNAGPVLWISDSFGAYWGFQTIWWGGFASWFGSTINVVVLVE